MKIDFFLITLYKKASVYEACDCMRTPLQTPKTLKTCKKARLVWLKKLQGMQQIAYLKQRFLSFTFYKCFDHIFEIKKKENNAAVLRLLTDANLKILLYWWRYSIVQFRISKIKSSIVNKRLLLRKFSLVSFFTSCVKKWNLKGNSIKLSTFLKSGLTEVKKLHRGCSTWF